MGLMYDLYFEKSTSDNSPDTSDMEVSEEVETPEESTEEIPEESTEETPEETTEDIPEESTEEIPEESTEETPEESTEEIPEESTEETPEESTEESNQEIIVSVNGIDFPTFTTHLSVCIFLLACLLGVCLFNIFRSKL